MVTVNVSEFELYVLLPFAIPVIPTLACGQLIGMVLLAGKLTKSLAGQTVLVFSKVLVRLQCQVITAPFVRVMLTSAVICHGSFVVVGLNVLGSPPLVVFVMVLLIIFTWLPSTT